MQDLKGLATGIGSFPHQDADAALNLIFQCVPQIPYWPQLPKRDAREGMVEQFSEHFPFLEFDKNGLKFNSSPHQEKGLEEFYEKIIANDLEYFKISNRFAQGLHKFYQKLGETNLKEVKFIKCQITGPFSFAASIKDNSGKSLLHDPVLFQAILKGLILKAAWQIKLFKKFGKKVIIFVDEPYLGCFGSAYTPINRDDVVSALSELSSGIKLYDDPLIGIHCCGNTDWSIFTDLEAMDIINLDAFNFLDRFVLYADSLKKFLKRGGIICWGIVPTQEFSGKETPESLVRKLESGIDILVKKGIDRDLLLNQLLISPACGLGSLDPSKAEKILQLLSRTSSLIRRLH